MNPDEEAETALSVVDFDRAAWLDEGYMKALTTALFRFARGLGFNAAEARERIDGVSRLFVRFDSFPSRSVWTRQNEPQGTRTTSDVTVTGAGPTVGGPATPTTGTPEQRAASAYAAWKKGSLETAAYSSIVEVLKVKQPSAVYQGRGGRMLISRNATEADFAEAFR